MAEIMDFLAFILIIVVAVAVNKAKKAGKTDMNARRANYNRGASTVQQNSEVYKSEAERRMEALREARASAANRAAYSKTLKSKDSATAHSNYGSSAANFDSSLRAAAVSAGHGQSSGLRSSSVLKDDRQNDWMAQQMRLERRIKASTDLGAQHDVNCDARALKREHIPRHGLD